ncbi:unnamed protein product [Didymodactylos carnosus]|uniref:Uncharacterized protein n=1 Tax=Didymodactylos carnosus TaxID=1234261 RepID=A0A8S2FVP0_9BILA|nr:unnamed protein product [Didymodactylos carnosus]CAF4365953.1 unnamed protein product [Didymodactylos carnosus]
MDKKVRTHELIVVNIPCTGRTTEAFSKRPRYLAKNIGPDVEMLTVARSPPAVKQSFQNNDQTTIENSLSTRV